MSKKKVGLWMDSMACRRLDQFVEKVGEGKGDVVSAAVLLLVESPPLAQKRALMRAKGEALNEALGVLDAGDEALETVVQSDDDATQARTGHRKAAESRRSHQ